MRKPASHLAQLTPYDPKYLPAQVSLSANENSYGLPDSFDEVLLEAVQAVSLNRYPDPLAKGLRLSLANLWNLSEEAVLVGNGGDELLFNLALAWGGPGRVMLNCPPTFSVYETNALLTGTTTVSVSRKADFDIDEEEVLERLCSESIDFCVFTSPNNPTGRLVREDFLVQALEASDTLVVVDEAYAEFSGFSMVSYLQKYDNLVILRTFSKAYALAGLRVGYLLANPAVIRELIKVRQPYSVDVFSQELAEAAVVRRSDFDPVITRIIEGRTRLFEQLAGIEGVTPYPSDANFILFKLAQADLIWDSLYEQGVLIRDFSRAPGLEDCLRVTVGTEDENRRFICALKESIRRRTE